MKLILSRRNLYVLVVYIFSLSCSLNDKSSHTNLINENFKYAQKQYEQMLDTVGDSKQNPRTVTKDGKLRAVRSKDWTSGFFPGCLWYLYEFTRDDQWKKAAQKFTLNIEKEQYNDMMCYMDPCVACEIKKD